MWILPSRSRAHNVERLIDAWNLTRASTPVELCLDLNDPCLSQYEALDYPQTWKVVIWGRDLLSDVYNDCFRRHPQESFYGFIADDVVPITNEWDIRLIEVAGNDGMAAPSGGHGDYSGAPHFVLGGDLVRSIGWLALPGLDRLYVDAVWNDIAAAKGVLRLAPDTILEHWHFSNGKAMIDFTYRKHRKAEDKAIYENWKQRGYTQLDRRTDYGDPP